MINTPKHDAEPICCCGEPMTLGVVHRKDKPCFHWYAHDAEPAAWGYRKYDAAYDEVTYHFSDNSDEVAKHDQFPTPLYGPEVLDLLRRETAKNERVKELLREPSVEMILAAMGVHRRWENADGDFSQGYWQAIHAAMSAALLAEVEKEMNDANR